MSIRIRDGLLDEIEREAWRRQPEAPMLRRLKLNLAALADDHPLWVRADAAWAAWCKIAESGGWERGDPERERPRRLLTTYGQSGETENPFDFLSMFSEAVEIGVRVCSQTGASGRAAL